MALSESETEKCHLKLFKLFKKIFSTYFQNGIFQERNGEADCWCPQYYPVSQSG